MTQRKHSLIMSKWSPQIRTMLKWRVEWAHVFEEVLNDNNNALRGQARNNFGRRKKAFVVLWEKGAVRERAREKQRSRRGGGAQFRQEIPAEKVGPRPNYTALCQRLYTNAHVHAYTLTHSQLHTHRYWFVLQFTLSKQPSRVTGTNLLLWGWTEMPCLKTHTHAQNTLQRVRCPRLIKSVCLG